MPENQLLIHVVEDNDFYNKLLVHTLSLNPEYLVKSFSNGKDFIRALSQRPKLITLDYRLPDMNGEEILKKIKEFDSSIEVIVISDQEDVSVAVNLLKGGAYDYIVKTEEIRDRLLNLVKHIFSRVHLENQFAQLKKEVAGKYDFKKAIIGNSKAILSVFELIEKSLSVNLTVSITGETGTGKELVAKAIHYNGMRSSGSFIAVNLAALPDELVESELFGHEKGAFTGATARRKGKFEEANGGTIFLDEIAEIDSKVQKKLLRVLQERELSRIGGNETIRVDCRVITATHEDLYQAVKEGRFREDLYYRLLGLPIEMPALRDRGDDILLLAKYFLDRFCTENNILSKNLSEDCRHKLLAYSWPGNVRELKSVIELAAVLSNNADISASDLTLSRSDDMMPELMTESLSLREYNYKIVRFYLNRCEDDTAKVAEKLNIGQSTVYRLLKEFE